MITGRARLLLALMCVTAPGAADLHAWGPVGHEVVVRVALSQLTPEARAFVHDILGDEDPVAASNWADQIRRDRPQAYNWHFVNIPYDSEIYDPARDCRDTPSGDCVIAEIARARREIVDRRRAPGARAESLRFLLHFVGDMHQPLHSIDNRDRGGNDVIVEIDGYTPPERIQPPNLHAAWDSILIDERGLDSETYARQIIARLAREPIGDDGTIDVVAWAIEAHDVAVHYVYVFPGFWPDAPAREPVVLDRTYQRAAQAVIDRQLMRAGVRLARILNDAAKTDR